MRRLAWVVLTSCVLLTPVLQAESAVQIWTVDPLTKVFRDALPEGHRRTVVDAARGEHATFQVVVRATEKLTNLRAQAGVLTGKKRLNAGPARFVGYVPVDRPTQKPSRDQLRVPPCDYPDPLLEETAIVLDANQAQPVWITVPVPTDTPPGRYHGKVRLSWETAQGPGQVTMPIALRVYNARVDRTRLWVTDWFGMQWQHMDVKIEPESEAYYALLENYARNMAEHRHNTALISPLNLAKFTAQGSDGLTIDFSRFDRWVETFIKAGVIGRIEGGHIGGRSAGWDSPFVVTVWQNNGGQVSSKAVPPDSAEADRFYAVFFPALVAHLKEKGWWDQYVQHLADEPIPGNIEGYRAMAKLVRAYAPGLRIIEACHTKDLVGAMDIWVPQLNYWQRDYEHYQARQKQGDEVWFYTCVFPQEEYANRFIELPLIKTRLLHWINFKYGATGYLHWGYNQWTADSPYTHTTRPHGGPPYLPAGDPWIVYPGHDGPIDSIRFEAMRDGIEDHELLSQLAERDPKAAQAFAARMVQDFDKYDTNVEHFRAVRRELLKRLSK